MKMRVLAIPAVLAVALATTGCATTSPPAPQASAASTECKSVAVYTGRDEIRYQSQQGVPGSDIAKAEGNAEAGRLAAMTPRDRAGGPIASTGGQIAQNC
jgi:hypothetical protein